MKMPVNEASAILKEAEAHQKWFDSIRDGNKDKRNIAFAEFVAAMMQRREASVSVLGNPSI